MKSKDSNLLEFRNSDKKLSEQETTVQQNQQAIFPQQMFYISWIPMVYYMPMMVMVNISPINNVVYKKEEPKQEYKNNVVSLYEYLGEI
jgi:hypothetical protein